MIVRMLMMTTPQQRRQLLAWTMMIGWSIDEILVRVDGRSESLCGTTSVCWRIFSERPTYVGILQTVWLVHGLPVLYVLCRTVHAVIITRTYPTMPMSLLSNLRTRPKSLPFLTGTLTATKNFSDGILLMSVIVRTNLSVCVGHHGLCEQSSVGVDDED